MNCWHCERPAHGTCRFCGRAICKTHTKNMPFVLTTFNEGDSVRALVVEDALYCGICKPSEEPIELETKNKQA